MLGIYNGLTTFWILPLPVLVSWSRVVIQAHTPLQVFWGGAVGGGVTWLVFNYLLKG
jgi:membrane-associated phospholipid phosphatase